MSAQDNPIDFRRLFEQAPDKYLILDRDYKIVAVSDSYLEVTMTLRDDILGHYVFDVFPENPEDPEAGGKRNLSTSLETVVKTKAPHTMALQKYDIRRPASEGGEFEVRYWSPVNSPLLDENGEVAYFIHRVQDVTDFVRLTEIGQRQSIEIFLRSQEIQKRTEELEAANVELERLNSELQTARDQAVEASNLKSAFVANISHELRTPLAGVIGLNELLLSSSMAEDQRELAESIHDAATSLLVIVNDILDLSKIESGKAELESLPINVSSVIEDITAFLLPAAQRRNLRLISTFDRSIPQFLMGDPTRLRQVLLNLISNSIKFTNSGEVNIKAYIDSQDGDSVTVGFSITDTGIGIAPEERRFLFQPFSQVDSSNTRKYGGTGLGLSICKRFVSLMGGEIGVESEKGKGSTFWFKIPFARAISSVATTGKRPKVVVEPIPGNRRVLVVEDNNFIQLLVVKQLNNISVQTVTAKNGQEAVEAVRHENFDLILMDCQMPVMDGFDATHAIREMESGTDKHHIIIAMTASAMVGDQEKCLALGMDDYLSKPFSIEQLRAKLAQWWFHEVA